MKRPVELIAEALLAARDQAALIKPPAQDDPAFDLAAGYAVGAAITDRRRVRGEQPVGRKIGFTNAGIWAEYGVDAPLWAHVYDTTLYQVRDGHGRFSLAGTVAPRIEPELVLGLRHAPPPRASGVEELLPAIEWFALGFEIVDCHFAGWRFSLADAVADFGLHAALFIGPPRPVAAERPAELPAALAACRLTLQCDGAVIATGTGANALGSPLLALGHLVRSLADQGAAPLLAGEVITTGTLTPAFPISAGQNWSAGLEGLALPTLSLSLT